MNNLQLGTVEKVFADIIWENEPISSGELVKICKEKLEWKKSTTYTVLKKLGEKGIFKNENSIVRSVISKEDYYKAKSKQFVASTFNGSLPAFIAAFTSGEKIEKAEILEIMKILEG